jgi:hypothetical protein
MVDVCALQAAYNDAVAMGNNKLANELLALWRDTLADIAPERSLSSRRHAPSEARPELALHAA